jgi:hypothetical protein
MHCGKEVRILLYAHPLALEPIIKLTTRFSSFKLLNSSDDFTSDDLPRPRGLALDFARSFSSSESRAFCIAISLERDDIF